MIFKVSNGTRQILTIATIALALLGCSAGLRAIAHDGPHDDDDKPVVPTSVQPFHSHPALEIPAGQPVPTVRLSIVPDAKRGWNLEAKVTNFRFAPERVNTKSLTTEGHAHLMIDGQQVTRLYGPWYYLGNLSPGKHTIEVTLNTNSHEVLTHNGKPISATTTIEVPVPR